MNCFVMVEQLEVEEEKPHNECSDDDKEKNTLKSKNAPKFRREICGFHAAPSVLQDNFDADIFRHLNAHELSQCTFIGVKINEPFVNPHLPAVPCRSTLTVGALADRYDHLLCRKGNRACKIYSGTLCNLFDAIAYHLNFIEISP